MIRNNNKKVIYLEKAKAYEKITEISSEEFHRKVRIITRGFTGIKKLFFKVKLSVWMQLFFRKAIRWFVGFLLPIIFISNLLVFSISSLFATTFFIQLVFYFLAILFSLGIKNKITSFPFYYCLVSIAGVAGTLNGLFGNSYITWNIPKSSRY